jgi:hypothetical protein
MSNTLSTLNDNLFQLFNDVKNDKVNPEKAQALVSISKTIIEGAKTQINGINTFQKNGYIPDVLEGTNPKLIGDTFEKKTTFAKSKGFKSVALAMAELGKDKFEQLYKNYSNN